MRICFSKEISLKNPCYNRNSIVDYMIDGTAIKEALTNGRNGDGRDCDAIYANCPLDRDSAIGLLKKFLPFHTK